MMTLGWILLGLIAVLVLWVWATYNGLVTLKTRTQEAWADIDTQLKRRFDLIPNLVATVQGYARHERELFEGNTSPRECHAQVKWGHECCAQSQVALGGALRYSGGCGKLPRT